MKVGTPRFIVVAVITGLMLVAGSTAAWAQDSCGLTTPNYSSDFSANSTCIKLNGNSPAFVVTGDSGPTVLRLTPSSFNQYASAWFKTKQPVQNGFSTTFRFQFTNPSGSPADGIAFVIQNSSDTAIGAPPNGGALAYGDNDGNTNNTAGEGIPNSLAIEIDTYPNAWDTTSTPHVAVQSCGAGKNTSHHGQVCANNGLSSTLGLPVSTPSLANNLVHKVTITYAPPAADCTTSCLGSLHVILDDVDLYSTGVPVDLSTLGLSDGAAYLGFTGATGGSVETQDILTWTFTPTSQSAVVTQGQQATIPFQDDAFNYTAQKNTAGATTVQITPILITPEACHDLVNRGSMFTGAQCFIYKDAGGPGVDSPVLFELTCPQLSSTAECNPFDADLGTQFDLAAANLPLPSNPFPGWLKGNGGVSGHPCTPPSGTTPLFLSNQISSFLVSRIDPFTKGKSGGTGSCWVATYNTPNEAPSVVITSPASNGVYQQNQPTTAAYACSTVDNTPGSTGPYLTPTSCTATNTYGTTTNNVSSGAPFDTGTVGTHTFKATVVDSGTDSASSTVTYTVVGSTDLAILNLAALKAPVNSTLTYAIGVGDLGGATAVGVTVTDTFPSGLTPQSGSGSNVSCAIVNRRLTCTTVPFTCSVSGQTVSCPLGPIAPLSLSSLNGATLQIKAKVVGAVGTTLKNTATVGSSNADSKLSNNSSTASTLVTAH